MAGPDVRPITRLQRYGVAAVVIILAFIAGGSLFVWSGYYNVSANRDHWGVTTWLLTQVRDQSIRARAGDIEVPDLSDPGLIALGAEHYRGGCANCHGAPGELQNPIYAGMLPRPPDLRFAADDYEPGALFWIVRSGLKYTGMPAWPTPDRPDEVWAVVAFLEALNAGGAEVMPAAPDIPSAVETASRPVTGLAIAPLENCVRCHGDGDTPPIGPLVPSLNGQSPAYLARALAEYQSGRRESGFMQPIAHGLADTEITALADYYADLPPVPTEPVEPEAETLALGRQIALQGLVDSDIPACQSCHIGINPQFPKLDGQPAAYLAGQLELWRQGQRDGTAHAAIMAAVGTRLSAEQAEAVAAYYASLQRPTL